jgi:dihydroorotate dehydrogenase
MHTAFYDPTLSFEENYEKGPLANFENISLPKRKITKTEKFLGFDINVPFGIPAGPIPNSKFVQAAFSFGFDIITYKTVRANTFPSHPFPNILYVDAPIELHPDQTPRLIGKPETDAPIEMLSITNSFGVPSVDPAIWQQDVKKSLEYVGHGQMLILSFMGTTKSNQTEQEFLADFATAARLSKETGARVLEVNLSCPNIGNEGLVCYNLEMTEKVLKAIRSEIDTLPLIVKVGYYKDVTQLEKLAEIVSRYANAIAAINTLQIEIVDEQGNQALPGKNRLRSGVCGACIKWAGLEMTEKLNQIRQGKNLNYEILGVGGVMTANDYYLYKKAGADAVQSATGAMWNAYLAHDIWKLQNNQ